MTEKKMERECYEVEVQPYRKTDYNPIIDNIYINNGFKMYRSFFKFCHALKMIKLIPGSGLHNSHNADLNQVKLNKASGKNRTKY